MTRGLARDLGADRIRLNSITPGLDHDPAPDRSVADAGGGGRPDEAQVLKEKVYPPDIARMVLFLASDDSRLISAQNFIVDWRPDVSTGGRLLADQGLPVLAARDETPACRRRSTSSAPST
jgi:NAD(P)-dependent dehydrogenase (short-subunit alcohol dehydrogenase family)